MLDGLEAFRDYYLSHIENGVCTAAFDAVPCVAGCPANVDVPGYIALIREERYADAVRLIRKDNPFPGVCGLICEHPCEAHCRRSMVDDAVNICGIKRFACDHATDWTAPPCAAPTGKRIAVVTIEGEIKDGGDGPGMTGERDAVRRIRAVRESPDYAALVVRIDSPGGSPVASELIRRELELVKKAGKPVVASFGDYAASGGYWVALGADTIVTDPMSITGSIGVFGMMPTFEKAISRLSLGTGGVATSPLADAMNPLKSVTPEYGKMMELSVARIYRDFISLVAKGRKMDEQKVAALAQGRVFTGRQAIDMGLADTLGGLDVALAKAAEMANVPGAQAEFIERDGSGLSVMVMRLMRRAMVETGFAEAMRLATPAVQVLEPVQRLQQTVSGSMPLYVHCLCTPQ